MQQLVLSFIILLSCLILKTHQREFHHNSEEVIFRVTRGAHSHDGECRYKKSSWSDCDSSSMQRKTLTLKRGDSMCEQTKVVTRHCKTSCKYEKGEWSECDLMTNSRVRTDSLKPKSDSLCQPTRTLTKKCKKACKYNKQAAWSECDSTTGKRSKVLNLKNGNPQVCEAQKKITKSCQKASKRSGRKSNGGIKHDDYDEEK